MLKGIPDNISPELLGALAEMGHGDTIAIVDNFYPAVSECNGVTVYAKGNGVAEMLESILKLMPLDWEYEEYPVKIIKPDAGFEDKLTERPATWDKITELVEKYEPNAGVGFITRSDFYIAAHNAYITLSTSEDQPYSCVILQKGVK